MSEFSSPTSASQRQATASLTNRFVAFADVLRPLALLVLSPRQKLRTAKYASAPFFKCSFRKFSLTTIVEDDEEWRPLTVKACGQNMHSQFAASSIREALADLHMQASLGTSQAFATQLAESTCNSQRVELATDQLEGETLKGTSQTPTRSEVGSASSTRNTQYPEYAAS